jgi:hypothetical protein
MSIDSFITEEDSLDYRATPYALFILLSTKVHESHLLLSKNIYTILDPKHIPSHPAHASKGVLNVLLR